MLLILPASESLAAPASPGEARQGALKEAALPRRDCPFFHPLCRLSHLVSPLKPAKSERLFFSVCVDEKWWFLPRKAWLDARCTLRVCSLPMIVLAADFYLTVSDQVMCVRACARVRACVCV